MAAPCNTFSGVRGLSAGPPPLRGASGPDRYGFKDLPPNLKEQVRIGTLLAMRAIELATVLYDAGLPFVLENPSPRDGCPSFFRLDETIALQSRKGMTYIEGPQCMCGASSYKGTGWLTNCALDPLPPCNHPTHEWIVPASGQVYKSPHMKLIGKAPAVLLTDHFAGIDTNVQQDFLTKRAAAYPARANRWLLSILATAKPRCDTGTAGHSSSAPLTERGKTKEQRLVRQAVPSSRSSSSA